MDINIPAAVSAQNLQSLFQLAVAVSLTFAVAGPRVRSAISEQLSGLAQTEKTLGVLKADSGSQFLDDRQKLAQETLLLVEEADRVIAPNNPATLAFYAGAAAMSFAGLVYCSFSKCFNTLAAIVFVVIIAVVVLRDALTVTMKSLQLRRVVSRLHWVIATDGGPASDQRVVRSRGIVARAMLGEISVGDVEAYLSRLAPQKEIKERPVYKVRVERYMPWLRW